MVSGTTIVILIHLWIDKILGAVLPMGGEVETMSTFDVEGEDKSDEIYEKDRGWTAVGDRLHIIVFLPSRSTKIQPITENFRFTCLKSSENLVDCD